MYNVDERNGLIMNYIDEVKNNIGIRIKFLRIGKKMTQTELAERLNISKSIISAYEKGSRIPSVDTLIHIAYIFDVPTGIFFTHPTEEEINPITVTVNGLTKDQIYVVEAVIRGFKAQNENEQEEKRLKETENED